MKYNTKILIALACGAAIGGVLGILFAPDKGEETRKKFKMKGKKMAEEAEEFFNEARSNFSALKENISKNGKCFSKETEPVTQDFEG